MTKFTAQPRRWLFQRQKATPVPPSTLEIAGIPKCTIAAMYVIRDKLTVAEAAAKAGVSIGNTSTTLAQIRIDFATFQVAEELGRK